MRTLALCGASCKRRSFFYCTGAAWKSLQLLPLLMVEGCVGRSWAVWTGAMGFADELRMYGVLGSSHSLSPMLSARQCHTRSFRESEI
jgi:hypothetical protein